MAASAGASWFETRHFVALLTMKKKESP